MNRQLVPRRRVGNRRSLCRRSDPANTHSARVGWWRVGWVYRWLYRATRAIPALTIVAAVTATGLVVADTASAADLHPVWMAVASLDQVVNNLRLWLMGILAAIATLFLTVGAARYVMAAGDPSEVEKAKSALKSAGIGYGLALLAPVLVTLVKQLVG